MERFRFFPAWLKKKKKKVCMTTRFFLGLLWAEQSRIFLLVLLLFVLAHTLPPMLVWCTYIVFSVILCTLTLNANNSQPTVVAQPNVVVNKGNTSSSSSSSVVHV